MCRSVFAKEILCLPCHMQFRLVLDTTTCASSNRRACDLGYNEGNLEKWQLNRVWSARLGNTEPAWIQKGTGLSSDLMPKQNSYSSQASFLQQA